MRLLFVFMLLKIPRIGKSIFMTLFLFILSCFHQHNTYRVQRPKYNRQQSFPCTSSAAMDYDNRRLANISIQVIGDNGKTHSNDNETTTTGPNSILPYRSSLDLDEPETLYCLNVSFYQPIAQPKHNHEVSLLSMHHIIDFNHLQMLRYV